MDISLLTFNTGLLRLTLFGKTLFAPVAFPTIRKQYIPDALIHSGADVLCLQEVFLQKDREFFVEKLSADYPYFFFEPQPKVSLSSGLIVFSKFPLVNPQFETFRFRIWTEKLAAHKGFMSFSIQTPSGLIHIVNTHATVGGVIAHPDSTLANGWRDLQVYQIIDHFPSDSPTILAGDFNASPQVSTSNYDHVLRQGYVSAYNHIHKRHTPTWSKKNPLNKLSPLYALDPSQQMDHVFVKNISLETIQSARVTLTKPVVIKEAPFLKTPLSDHFAVQVDFRF